MSEIVGFRNFQWSYSSYFQPAQNWSSFVVSGILGVRNIGFCGIVCIWKSGFNRQVVTLYHVASSGQLWREMHPKEIETILLSSCFAKTSSALVSNEGKCCGHLISSVCRYAIGSGVMITFEEASKPMTSKVIKNPSCAKTRVKVAGHQDSVQWPGIQESEIRVSGTNQYEQVVLESICRYKKPDREDR